MGCINRPGDAVAVTITVVLDWIPASRVFCLEVLNMWWQMRFDLGKDSPRCSSQLQGYLGCTKPAVKNPHRMWGVRVLNSVPEG